MAGGSRGLRERKNRAPRKPEPHSHRTSSSEAGRGYWSDTATTECASEGRKARISGTRNSRVGVTYTCGLWWRGAVISGLAYMARWLHPRGHHDRIHQLMSTHIATEMWFLCSLPFYTRQSRGKHTGQNQGITTPLRRTPARIANLARAFTLKLH